MRFGVLGPLEVDAAGEKLSVSTRKRQSVLALLAVNAGRVVGIVDLIDELWPEGPPASAVANARGYASGLRRLFEAAEPGRERLVRLGSGYVLNAEQGELDLAAFTADVAAGREAMRRGDANAAAALARYADARAALAEQLDVEPGPDLRELHRAILNRVCRAVATWLPCLSWWPIIGAGGPRVIVESRRAGVPVWST